MTLLDQVVGHLEINRGTKLGMLVSTLTRLSGRELNERWPDRDIRGQVKAWCGEHGLDFVFTDSGRAEKITFTKL